MNWKAVLGIVAGLAVIGGVNNYCTRNDWYKNRMERAEDALEKLQENVDDSRMPAQLSREYLEGFAGDYTFYKERIAKLDEIKPSQIESDKDKEKLRELKTELAQQYLQLESKLLSHPATIVSTSGSLPDSIATIPVWLEKGETLNCAVQSDQALSVGIYNYGSRAQLADFKNKTTVNHSFQVPYSAIYLVRIVPSGRQYASVDISYKPNSMERLMRPATVEISNKNSFKGEFLSQEIDGVKLTDAFLEPQRITLRSGLKSAFSGSTRSIIPIQIAPGTKDLLYNLQISNNEDKPNEKDFNKGMTTSYRKIRILGLPVYDSQGGSGLLTTLLGLNTPVKEEESYANMYVFFDAGQARAFQNGKPVTQLKYNLDHSVQGTQSRNGRIPVRGNNTVYLGFENERMRYSTYIWLQAMLSKPTTEYVTTTYEVKQPDKYTKFVKNFFEEKEISEE